MFKSTVNIYFLTSTNSCKFCPSIELCLRHRFLVHGWTLLVCRVNCNTNARLSAGSHGNCEQPVHCPDFAPLFETGSNAVPRSCIPCLGVPADAHKWQGSHSNCVYPAHCHYLARCAKFQSFIEVYGVCNGVPALAGNHRQREDGQLASEDCEETCHLASGTCGVVNRLRCASVFALQR